MNEIMFVNVSTENDPDLIQIGSTLSSTRGICRFLKNFQKQNVLRSPVKTYVESLLRLCSLGSLSASRLDSSFSNLGLELRKFKGQLQCKACVAGSRAARELAATKSDQEACEARSGTPLELGARISNVLEESKMKIGKNAKP